MNFKTDYKLEEFILGIEWEKLPKEVQYRMCGCLIDLLGALIVGSRSEQFAAGVALAESTFPKGEVAAIGTDKKFSFIGAATAMGHSSNAYDIDDGHNITRAHPGTSFIGAALASAYEENSSLRELLCALLGAYEVTVRMGAAIMDYYQFAHSSGTFGAVGSVAAVARLRGYSKERLNNALSVAEFNAPLVPGIRSVEYPSMNKDGVPFGVMIGALALLATECGFTGNKNLLESDEYRHYLDGIGEKYTVMDLYFKPYPCCRWAHPAIDALTSLMRENGISYEEVEAITVKTFERATRLSKIEPKCADDAQYNIAYPVAAAAVFGDFGISEVLPDALSDERVLAMMKRLSFEVDPDFDSRFPAERLCRVEVKTKDGRVYISGECAPRGEACENIGIDWLVEKIYRIAGAVYTREGIDNLLALVLGDLDIPVRHLVDTINTPRYWR